MSERYLKTPMAGFVKDTVSGAVLNTDNNALDAYKRQKSAVKMREERMERIEREMCDLKTMIRELITKIA